jgi:bifunctional DNA primase/polymerase-like protein
MDSTQSNQLTAALVCLDKGWWVFPLFEKTKKPHSELAPNGFNSSSNDPAQIREWWTKSPRANVGIDLGKSNLTVLDFDRGRPPAELNLPETLLVNTSRGTHVYFSGVSEQGNMFFKDEHVGEIKSVGGYVLSAYSIHPDGPEYSVAHRAAIVPLPEDLLSRLKSTKTQTHTEVQRDAAGLIPHGQIHNWMLREAGRLRGLGLGEEGIRVALRELVEKNCAPPINWEKVDTMAKSICNFPEGRPTELLFTQASQTAVSLAPPPEIDASTAATRPEFPIWALKGTSIYEELVAPAIATSSKHAEFIAMPAIQIFLNYLSGRLKIGLRSSNLNIFVGLISPYGDFFKSTSCELAMNYFNFIGLLLHAGRDTKSADNKIAVTQAGSPEGFGIQMQRMNAKHAILFNDELGKFVSKAGIESSAFSSDLLSWYGSAPFGNNTTNPKNAFNFQAGDYTFSWLWATTDRGFNRHWPKLAGISSGLEDRMFFVVSPEKPKPAAPYQDPVYVERAVRTRQLIDKAVNQEKFEFDSPDTFAQKVKGLNPRSIDLAQKLAVYFAVDMGATAIDDEHIERAIALVQYRNQAAAFLSPIEADTKEGRLQKEIIRELQQNCGKISYRAICKNLDYQRYGTFEWDRAYKGLLKAEIICEFFEDRTPGKRATRMTGLVKQEDE